MITTFSGKYSFLSNFYRVIIPAHDGLLYPSVEHAYQAHKTLNLQERYRVSRVSTPGAAKKAGRKLPLRPDWNSLRLSIMEELCCSSLLLVLLSCGKGDP
jgi:predicted NAD-dependent protein-ADP-ribosyltransferase YbiA (DUF1768 family)